MSDDKEALDKPSPTEPSPSSEEVDLDEVIEKILSDTIRLIGKPTSTATSPLLETGKHLPGGRIKAAERKWMVKMAHASTRRIAAMPKDVVKDIDAIDIYGILEDGWAARRSAFESKKKAMVRNAVLNAFKKDLYDDGLSRRVIQTLMHLIYGDVRVLHGIYKKQQKTQPTETKVSFVNLEQLTRRGHEPTLLHHHFAKLYNHGLLLRFDDLPHLPSPDGLRFTVTGFGKRLLDQVGEPESRGSTPTPPQESPAG